MRKVQWGVLSTAQIGTNHVIPAMQKGELSHIAAIASRGLDKAQAAAAALGIERAYGSYEDLLADPAIEAVYNPLPNHLHVPWSLKALEAGKHVLCEKPVALTAAEAETLAAAATRTGKVVAEAFMVRHHPQWRIAKEIVDSGRIGAARAIQTVFAYHLTDPSNIRNQAGIGGGGLYDIGCYAIATARTIFGGEPERVAGLFDIDPMLGTDRMVSGLAAFGDGRTLGFVCGTQLVPCQRVEILGTKGRIEIAIPFNAPNDLPGRIAVDDGRDLTGGGREVITVPLADQYTLQGDAVSRAILREAPLAWGLDDAVANMRVIDAFFRAARSGGWERP
ncbi:Gfo/Idh/MocA family oxidoreductase [Lichenihabitans sp. Uapishka_5]|uniref:Gfo/Idh/MocA family protein n=1 Tax=Lichenihabitans sp. Uapishka_5 TaxID=3037302 RepID=UPI0029E7FCD4|nr:Gfo/Idh/MocA family oxidoreductase [Lichenihabitans sp. Uapishka_5]MDX7953705.1 Gfo/Idh/MocA family oxidoreductase [Lichenihabitans sp. Uapishka_5]